MSNQTNKGRGRLSPVMLLLLSTTAAVPAFAADPETPAAESVASVNPTVNLINLLVKRGVLSKEDATGLIKQANEQAAAARRTPARSTAKAKNAPATAPTAAVTTTVSAAPPSDGAMHITYVPDVVKQQLRDEIKQDVLAQARQENWAAPDEVPDWTKRIHVYGDIRMRYENNTFPSGNDNTGSFPNFNGINTGSPFLASPANPNFPPQRNVDQNRNYERLRARIGIDADLGEGFSTGMRIATGQDDSPTSENQTFGLANNAQGGNFSKYSIWIDRAYIKYTPWNEATKGLEFEVGRFDNPFFSTDLIWWSDIGFDGVAVKGRYEVAKGIMPFITAGAFPVFNTDLNFASNQPAKFSSSDKWLYAVQAGSDFKIDKDYHAKIAAAYYYFDNVQGRLSSPCAVNSAADICDTDDLRPSFAQNGNSYMPLRNIIPQFNSLNQVSNNYQYYGLASSFHELALTGRLDFSHFDPTHMWVTGEFVDNLGFNRSAISQVAVNNRGATSDLAPIGNFVGGNKGYLFNFNVGHEFLTKRWDWNAGVGYRYIESDAVVDAFNDPDFGLGGTNLKGYTITGNLAFSSNVWASLKWMSADSVSGPPLSIDVLLLDLNARF